MDEKRQPDEGKTGEEKEITDSEEIDSFLADVPEAEKEEFFGGEEPAEEAADGLAEESAEEKIEPIDEVAEEADNEAVEDSSEEIEEPAVDETVVEKTPDEKPVEEKRDEGQSRVFLKEIEKEMKTSYLDYSMSVIVGRALPDIRDGLKPVHRRILYAMHQMGMFFNKPYKKSARIVGECFVKDTLVLTENGLMPVQDIKKGEVVFTQNGKNRVVELYEMPEKPLIEVVLENGISNIVTPSQKFKILNENLEYQWKEAKDLSESDYLVIRSYYPDIDNYVKLNNGKSLNENIAYLLGFLMSDGWVENNRRLGFYSVNLEIIKKISKILFSEFNYSSYIEEKNYEFETKNGRNLTGTGYTIRINNKEINDFFISDFNLNGLDASTKKIPRQIFRSPRSIIFSFISGLIDGDGSIHTNRNVIHYGSISVALIDKLQVLLQYLGIYSKRYIQIQSKSHFIGGRKISSGRPFHYVEISGQYAKMLSDELMLIHKVKYENITRIKSSRHIPIKADQIPYAGKVLFNELSKHHLGGGWYKYNNGDKFRKGIKYKGGTKIRYSKDLRDKFLTKTQIAEWEILDKLKNIGSPFYDTIKKIIDNKISFIRVLEIKNREQERTYDIQVEGEHEFIANSFISHNCLGKYHPHGDSAVYDAMVRMVQEFSLRYPLVNGQGNFGSIDGDNAAAMRYTEARLHKISNELLQDIEKETVDFIDNFDGTLKEPSVLPSKIPNLLVNGSSGIAVGMATNIPPHNLREVGNAIVALIDNPEISVDGIMEHIKGPDFPTSGIICGMNGIKNAYNHGRGKIIVRARARVEQFKGSRERIIVTEIPYMVNKAMLIEEIAGLVKDKRIEGISDLRDESDRQGMRIVIELKTDANAEVILNQLYKHSRMQTTFGVIMLSLVNKRPVVLDIKAILAEYVKHRQDVVKRRTSFDLKKAQARAHILEGLIVALDHIDEVVAKIKASSDVEKAKNMLMADYELSEEQSKAILDMKLQKLASLERQKIKDEYKELMDLIEELKAILASEERILGIIKEETEDMVIKYGDDRKTQIDAVFEEDEDFDMEDLIQPEDMVVTMTHAGYIKRLPIDTYREQRRGGKGVKATGKKDEDFVEDVFVANTHDYMLLFTNHGKIKWLKVYRVPEGSRAARGTPLVNLVDLSPDERVMSYVRVKDFGEGYIFMCTKKGRVKRVAIDEFSRPRKGGIMAIDLREGDELINTMHTSGGALIMIATRKGQAVKFKETDVRPMGRTAAGVRGISLKSGDEVVDMVWVDDDMSLLTVTENGYGKRTKSSDYRKTKRGGLGVRNIIRSKRNGDVVCVKSIEGDESLLFISKDGIAMRTKASGISVIGRNTQGVRLMNLASGDKVVSAAKIINGDDDEMDDAEDMLGDVKEEAIPAEEHEPEQDVVETGHEHHESARED